MAEDYEGLTNLCRTPSSHQQIKERSVTYKATLNGRAKLFTAKTDDAPQTKQTNIHSLSFCHLIDLPSLLEQENKRSTKSGAKE